MSNTAEHLDFTDYKRHLLAKHLQDNIKGEVRFDPPTCLLYSTDASIYQISPLGVVIPKSVEDMQTVMQVAADMRVPITARGGGTSLSGQSIGPGVILDCSKYLNKVLEVDPENRWARVQPGVVLDQLNRTVATHGLMFGPDVATATRANLGGMIGNNSAGAHSIVYGKTIDHIQRLSVILSDGSRTDLSFFPVEQWEKQSEQDTFLGNIHRQVRAVVQENSAEINRRFPKILRRVSGYNLDELANALSTPVSRSPQVGLHQLIVGSEGSLALVTEAEVDLVPKPAAVGLVMPHFDSLAAAMDTLAFCLEHSPSAVELMDRRLIELAKNNLSLRETTRFIEGQPASLLMVELAGEREKEVADRMKKLSQRLQLLPGVTAVVCAETSDMRHRLWNLRSAAMPLLLGMKGDRKPVTFVEDTAVSPDRLPGFVARFQEILRRHGTEGAFYGHASVGCLHIRPILNLKDPVEIARMRQITEDITDLVLTYGGSLSGEHGDGLARSEWNRKMFGDQIYQAFRRVKQAFDPENLLNPGKVVNGPAMTENLRYGTMYKIAEPTTILDFSKQEGFAKSIEMCNGNGACRKLQGGTMCPSYRATLDEKDTTRGRANALRLALSGNRPMRSFRSSWVMDILDLCLMCKACKSECPSNVDMAKLKSEVLHLHYQQRLRPPGHFLMGRMFRLFQLGSFAPGFTNSMNSKPFVRWLMEKVAGIDHRRSIPEFQPETFRRWFHIHTSKKQSTGKQRVILLDDCFTNATEPEIGKAAVKVLEAAGYEVELAGLICCCRPQLSKGMLTEARGLIAGQMSKLAYRVADGTPILGLEPSCLLSLIDEWPDLIPGQPTEQIAESADLLDHWLARQVEKKHCTLPLNSRPGTCVVHGHCHLKAIKGAQPTLQALKLIPGLNVEALDTGCCGMAGSFGYEKEHYDLSVAIAKLDLLPKLEERSSALVIAPGTSCRHQIKDLAGRRAYHPVELLAEQVC